MADGWRTIVTIGDSFTEGVGDPDPATGLERGWADRLAQALAREHAPWVVRRVRGESTGDGRPPKRPAPTPVVLERSGR